MIERCVGVAAGYGRGSPPRDDRVAGELANDRPDAFIRDRRPMANVLDRRRAWRRRIGRCLLGVLVLAQLGCAALGLRPEPPTVSIAGVRPVAIGLDRQQLEFRLRVSNPNAFALPLEALDFTASLAGEAVATGSSREAIEIPARGDAIVSVTVDAGFGRVLDRLRRMLDERELVLDYAVAGTVTLANWPRPLPFDVIGEVEP